MGKEIEKHICEYGCGREAKYQFQNGKWCCESNITKCSAIRKRNSESSKGKIPTTLKYIENSEHICEYGCGREAHYHFKNGKWCCESNISKCSAKRKETGEKNKGKIHSEETLKKMSESNKGKTHSKETLKKMSESIKYSLKDYQEKHPLFCLVEELREHPETGEIQGHCKNHNCPNSKEKNGWFTLSSNQVSERIRRLESESGNGACYFYCSKECKNTCLLFGKSVNQIMKQDLINAGHLEEYSSFIPGLGIWKQEVFKRNKDEYKQNQCEICGETENLIAHHVYPQKIHPEMALDPDNGLIVCPECHVKKCHPAGSNCSYGELAKLVCVEIYDERKKEK